MQKGIKKPVFFGFFMPYSPILLVEICNVDERVLHHRVFFKYLVRFHQNIDVMCPPVSIGILAGFHR